MRSSTIIVFAVLVVASCGDPPGQDSAPVQPPTSPMLSIAPPQPVNAEPPPAEVAASPVAEAEAPAEQEAEAPAEEEAAAEGEKAPAQKPPKSFGVKVCDEYAELACACQGRAIGDPCADAHATWPMWRKIAKRKTMRSFVEQGCRQAIQSIETACR